MAKNELLVKGTIPEKVVYIWGAKKTLSLPRWSNSRLDIAKVEGEEVTPAFPADAAAKSFTTAHEWAKGTYGWQHDKSVPRQTYMKEFPNAPFKGLRLAGLDERGNGGRAWKVITPDNFLFDIREDVLFDILMNCTCSNGQIEGDFVWAKMGSQMRLVRVGSELHNAFVKASIRSASKVIPQSELEVGRVYSDKTGRRHAFFGFVETVRYETAMNNGETILMRTPLKKRALWYSLQEGNRRINTDITSAIARDMENNRTWDFSYCSTSKVHVREEETVPYTSQQIIDWIREKAIKQLSKNRVAYNKEERELAYLSDLCLFSDSANLSPAGKLELAEPYQNLRCYSRKPIK